MAKTAFALYRQERDIALAAPIPLQRRPRFVQRHAHCAGGRAGRMDGNRCGTDAIRQEVVRLAGERMTQAAIAGQLKIGEAIVYRILAAASKQKS
jgi:hypothetical protein